MEMKNFNKFLEEISIEGNPGIPSEGGKRDGDKEYLSDLERDELNRLGLNRKDDPRMLNVYGGELARAAHQLHMLSRGKERELEELAKEVILSEYGDILDNVILDIKIGNPSELLSDKEDESESEADMPSYKEVTDKDLIDKINKGKITNIIMQGEGKNTKRLYHTEAVRDGLIRIFGESSANRIISLLEEITTAADRLDWVFPINMKKQHMERDRESGNNFAGAVKIEWKPKEVKPTEEGEEVSNPQVDQEEDEIHDEFTPVIKVRAIDFAMLLHETVKGIFELIASVSAPEMGAEPKEIEDFETVKVNISSFDDEIEDFRTGPKIASDFRDFIDERPEAHKIKNIRTFIFGKMCDNNYMSPKEFLELFRGVLNNTDEAKRKMDKIIKDIIKEFDDYENDSQDNSHILFDNDDEHEDYEDSNNEEEVEETPIEQNTEVDYSKLKPRELQELIDQAIDDGDYDLLSKLTPYMKNESMLLIYTNELKLIKENLNPHNKK